MHAVFGVNRAPRFDTPREVLCHRRVAAGYVGGLIRIFIQVVEGILDVTADCFTDQFPVVPPYSVLCAPGAFDGEKQVLAGCGLAMGEILL